MRCPAWATCLGSQVAACFRLMLARARRHWHAVAFTGLAFLVLFAALPLFLAVFELLNLEAVSFWLQTLAGNWPGKNEVGIRGYWFAVSAVLAVLLNNGVIFIVLLFVWNWGRSWRRDAMLMSRVVAVRDQAMKQELITAFGDDENTIDKINHAMSHARDKWRDEVREMFGDEGLLRADELIRQAEPTERTERAG